MGGRGLVGEGFILKGVSFFSFCDHHNTKACLCVSLLFQYQLMVLERERLVLWSSDGQVDGHVVQPRFAAFLMGSILSATDPVAVLGALKSLRAPSTLVLLIAGESLFNDGSAVVFFLIFWELAAGREAFSVLT